MAASRLDRAATWALERTSQRDWGFRPSLYEHLIAELGPIRGLGWAIGGKRWYDRAMRALGPIRTHLACVTISQLNGCRYTTYGHAVALELHYLRLHEKLFPVDADTLTSWSGLPRVELRKKLGEALLSAGLHVELLWVDRTIALLDGGQQPIDDDEVRLAHLIAQFEVLTKVGSDVEPDRDHAHDPINKDAAIKAELAELRAAAADPSGPGTE
jgi:hypothetical protein